MADKTKNVYGLILEEVFRPIIDSDFSCDQDRSSLVFKFTRDCFRKAAGKLGVSLPKNVGDIIYSFRYRSPLPESIAKIAPHGLEWIILGAGRSKYMARFIKKVNLVPNPGLSSIMIPDETSPIIKELAGNDEQFMLTKIRNSRLIGIFLGLTTWSVQNHLRTTVKDIGQIEIDELYVGLNRLGNKFAIPVQAKGHDDSHSVVQTFQDIAYCKENYPDYQCLAVSAQFMPDGSVALFKLASVNGDPEIVDELHYRLVGNWG